MEDLKYQGYSIVFQEVPDEISLAINISGCPYKCRGCHSKNLWEYEGKYLKEDFYCIIKDHEGLITCVLFMGGDQNKEELIQYCEYAHSIGLKTCLYTGATNIDPDLEKVLDYCKVGPYIEECGGLDKPTTNQRLYRIWTWNNKLCSEDITYKFSKEYRFRNIAD